MLKYLITALATLVLVLVGASVFTPVNATNATTEDPQVYIWDYAALGSHQVVCKQVVFHTFSRPLPKGLDVQPAQISSQVVDQGYCAQLTKPKA